MSYPCTELVIITFSELSYLGYLGAVTDPMVLHVPRLSKK